MVENVKLCLSDSDSDSDSELDDDSNDFNSEAVLAATDKVNATL